MAWNYSELTTYSLLETYGALSGGTPTATGSPGVTVVAAAAPSVSSVAAAAPSVRSV